MSEFYEVLPRILKLNDCIKSFVKEITCKNGKIETEEYFVTKDSKRRLVRAGAVCPHCGRTFKNLKGVKIHKPYFVASFGGGSATRGSSGGIGRMPFDPPRNEI